MANRIAVVATLAIRRVGLSRFKVAVLSIFQIKRAQPVMLQPPNDLMIDIAEREKVKTSVRCAATSIRVEQSRFSKCARLFGIYTSPRG